MDHAHAPTASESTAQARPASAQWIWIVIWLTASVIAALSCSLIFRAAHDGAGYVPVGNDSFYHARRILDAVRDPGGFYEFDQRIHAPEGSLLTWPWGYDYAMAMMVRVGLAAGVATDPMAILTWIPTAAVFVSIGLLVLIARRMQLPPGLTMLAALCMALVPNTQLLHGAGQIDHHFAEQIAALASLAAGLYWLQQPASTRRAILLGVVLGLASAIHNGLFILQVPILCTAFVLWLQQQKIPSRAALAFAAALLISTVLILLPSVPFRSGRFEFYTLSWFHLYIAGCSAAAMLLMSHLDARRRGVAIVVLVGAALAVPLLEEAVTARTFLGGMNKYFDDVEEMRSPASVALKLGFMSMARVYSLLIYLAPLTFALCVVQCWRERASARLLFWISCVFGLALLATQQRLHYFGGFALYLPWLILAADLARRHAAAQRKIYLGAVVAALVCYSPVLRYQLLDPMPLANDAYFEGVRPLYATLAQECAKDPGIVLADGNAGHPIRFYTDCPVLVNNFILTPQHFEKLAEADRLFSLSAEELARQPQLKYLLIRAMAMRELPDGQVQYKLFFSNTSRLANQLLFSPESELPPNYTLLRQMNFSEKAPYARLFRIEHSPAEAKE